jgi:hypothetical protein
MPGFGALRDLARQQTTGTGGKRIKTMTLHMPSHEDPRAGHVVEHEHYPPHPKETFRFAPNENETLAAYLSKHLGLKLPGKAAVGSDSAESAVSKSDFE